MKTEINFSGDNITFLKEVDKLPFSLILKVHLGEKIEYITCAEVF